MNARAFKLLIWNTIQKEIRSKSFFLVVALTFSILGISYAIMQTAREYLQVESNIEIIGVSQLLWVYFAFINAWSIFLGLMFGLGCVRSDVSSNVIGQLLALPISRSSYLVARVLGSWVLVCFYQTLSFLLTAFLFRESLGDISSSVLVAAPFISFIPSISAVILGLFVSLWLGKVPGLITTALASLGGGWARGHFVNNDNPFSDLTFLKAIGLVLWIIIPRFAGIYSIVTVLAKTSDATIQWVDIAQFSISTTLLLVLSQLVFGRRGY